MFDAVCLRWVIDQRIRDKKLRSLPRQSKYAHG